MPLIPDRDIRLDIVLPVFLALLTLAVFSPVVQHDFVNYDDPEFVVRNPLVQGGVTLDGILRAFAAPHEANWIPLAWLSHMLDVQIFGMDPAGHHFVNLLFHIANTLLLFLFLRRTTRATWQSAAVALLFALHPLHVESVAWIAERKDVLSAFFGMLTLNAYVSYADRPGIARYLSVLLLFVLGLLAKPMLVTLPLVLLLLDWWPLGRMRRAAGEGNGQTGIGWNHLAREKAPLFALSCCAGVITYWAHQADIASHVSFAEKGARAIAAYGAYLAKTFWPGKLAVLYPASHHMHAPCIVAVSLAVLFLITGGVFAVRRQHPYLVTGWLWYLITLLPVIGLVQIGHHSLADRYTYLPLIGVFILIAWGAADIAGRAPSARVLLAVAALALLTTMTVLTARQLVHWRDSISLFRHTIEVTEKNWIAHNNLGTAYLEQGSIDEAIGQFLAATAVEPSAALPYLNLGAAYGERNDWALAIQSYRAAILLDPACHPARVGLGLSYLRAGERQSALEEYYRLLAVSSDHASILREEIRMHDIRHVE